MGGLVQDYGPCVSNRLLGGAEAEGFGVGVEDEEPPRRSATAVAARHPSTEGISRRPAIHVQNSGRTFCSLLARISDSKLRT